MNKCMYQMKEIERIYNEYEINNLNSLINEYNNIKANLNDSENQFKLINLMKFTNKLVFR